jgi:hypothetical protein
MPSREEEALQADAEGNLKKASSLYYALRDEQGLSSQTCLNAAVLFYLGAIEPPFIIPIDEAIPEEKYLEIAEGFLRRVESADAAEEAAFWRLYWRLLLFDDDVHSEMAALHQASDCLILMVYLHLQHPQVEAFRQGAEKLLRQLQPIDSERKRYVVEILQDRVEHAT